MNNEILKIVDELFRRRLLVPELNLDIPLADYGLDSIRSIDLIVELESLLGVRISDEQAAAMFTLRDVVEQVTASHELRSGQGENAV